MAESTDHRQVLGTSEVLVHRGVLAGQPDDAADLGGILGDVEAQDRGDPGVWAQDRRQDSHCSGLA